MDTLIGDDDRERVGGRFADFEARIESLDRGLREIARSVRSTTALEGSLEDALRGELDSLARRSGIAASFSLDGDLGDLTDSQKIVLFRVVQESLANVRRHSAASAASVSIRSRRRFVDVTVTDNGRGFDRASAPAGRLGLSGISERARLLGGTVEIDSRLSVGTEVRITLPRWQPLATESTTPLYAASF
jgi:signal transduction histidine kinase